MWVMVEQKIMSANTHVGHGETKSNVTKCIGGPREKQDMNKEFVLRFERPVLVTQTKSGQKPQDTVGHNNAF
jgi:hypothetical protein